MRIAQLAPLYEAVPPLGYGGTERVVAGLREELVRSGHDVVLFASGDSVTSAELVPCWPRGLRLDAAVQDPIAHHIGQLGKFVEWAGEFDVIHNHIDYLALPVAADRSTYFASSYQPIHRFSRTHGSDVTHLSSNGSFP